MDNKRLVKISKYLARHLRHDPARIGLTLDSAGWASVDDLLRACGKAGFAITRAELHEVVAKNDKQRFSFSADGTQIRANQGHSIDVDLELEPATPPDVLYHGTGAQYVSLIFRDGLKKMSRHHVHLSTDVETARKVGSRHGVPVVFTVDARQMAADGHVFYCSANGVWLVDSVPIAYLTRMD
jgi:putative RNA 2'-phosphotransferase